VAEVEARAVVVMAAAKVAAETEAAARVVEAKVVVARAAAKGAEET